MCARLADEKGRQAKPDPGVGDAEEERSRTEAVARRKETRGERCRSDGTVAGRFVETHGEPPAGRPGEVDLHDDRGRPGEPLVDAQEDVREHHPRPGRRPDEEKRHRHPDEPAGDEDGLAAEAIGQRSCDEVRRCLHRTEGEDEAERRGVGIEVKGSLPEQGQHGAFLPDHPADQGVDPDEKGELGEVGPDPEADRRRSA